MQSCPHSHTSKTNAPLNLVTDLAFATAAVTAAFAGLLLNPSTRYSVSWLSTPTFPLSSWFLSLPLLFFPSFSHGFFPPINDGTALP